MRSESPIPMQVRRATDVRAAAARARAEELGRRARRATAHDAVFLRNEARRLRQLALVLELAG